MTKTLTPPTSSIVPTSFEDLFTNYYRYVVRLVIAKGISPQNAEDVAMTILTTFYEKDALADYDPEYTSVHQGQVRHTKFISFLSGFVLIYLRHYRDRQNIHAKREPALCNAPDYATNGRQEYVEVISQPTVETYDSLYMEDLVSDITRHLGAIEESSRSRVQMKEFFSRVLVMVNVEGSVDTAALAAEYKVSRESIRTWLGRLRVEIDAALEAR